jgi:hypothetical protein
LRIILKTLRLDNFVASASSPDVIHRLSVIISWMIITDVVFTVVFGRPVLARQ